MTDDEITERVNKVLAQNKEMGSPLDATALERTIREVLAVNDIGAPAWEMYLEAHADD
jgi:hypothetical protein